MPKRICQKCGMLKSIRALHEFCRVCERKKSWGKHRPLDFYGGKKA